MANINYGTTANFLGGGAARSTISALSASKFIVMYTVSVSSYHGYAKIGEVAGNVVTYGSSYEFLNATTNFDTTSNKYVAALTDSKAVLVYRNGPASNKGYALIADVTGTALAYGSQYEFSDSALYHVAVARLNDTQFIVAYQDSSDSNKGKIRIGSVAGTVITYGTAIDLVDSGESASYMSIVALSDSKFVIGFRDGTGDQYGVVKIGTVSGSDITLGSSYQFNGTNQGIWNSIDIFDESSFVITYTDEDDSNKGKANIGIIDGTTVTFGPQSTFFSGFADYGTVSVLDQYTFAITYRNKDDSNKGHSKIGHRYGSDIVGFGPTSEYFSGNVAYNNSDTLDSSRIIVSYSNLDSGSAGSGLVGEVSGIFLADTVDLFVGSPTIPISNSGSLFTYGIGLINDSVNSFIRGQETINDSINLFTFAPPPDLYKTATLYISGPGQVETSGNLFIDGFQSVSNSSNLFTLGYILQSGSIPLVVGGCFGISINGSIDLFMEGSGIPTSGEVAKPFDWFTRTPDYYPQLIGIFDTVASGATIQLWDVTGGQNTLVPITSNTCYAIGDTNRWRWSTSNIPVGTEEARHYFYLMTSNLLEIFDGQFILDVPERAKWIHPDNMDNFLKLRYAEMTGVYTDKADMNMAQCSAYENWCVKWCVKWLKIPEADLLPDTNWAQK